MLVTVLVAVIGRVAVVVEGRIEAQLHAELCLDALVYRSRQDGLATACRCTRSFASKIPWESPSASASAPASRFPFFGENSLPTRMIVIAALGFGGAAHFDTICVTSGAWTVIVRVTEVRVTLVVRVEKLVVVCVVVTVATTGATFVVEVALIVLVTLIVVSTVVVPTTRTVKVVVGRAVATVIVRVDVTRGIPR